MKFDNFKDITTDRVFKVLEIPQKLYSIPLINYYKETDPGNFLIDISAKDITTNIITVYNTTTHMFSDKSLYINKKGRLYFKGRSSSRVKHYYIDELIVYKE